MNTLIVLGGGGGAVAVLSAIIVIGRGIFRQVTATEENTAALNKLTGQVETLDHGYNGHETRIAILEDIVRPRTVPYPPWDRPGPGSTWRDRGAG